MPRPAQGRDLPHVKWNVSDAEFAATALRQIAAELKRSADDRERLARKTAEQWEGTFREEFRRYIESALKRARDLAKRYEDLAARVTEYTEDARALSRKREYEAKKKQQQKP